MSKESRHNKSTIPLNAGETFTGKPEECSVFGGVILYCYTDKDATLTAQFGIDVDNFDYSEEYDITAETLLTKHLTIRTNYFRLILENTSGEDQTELRLSSRFVADANPNQDASGEAAEVLIYGNDGATNRLIKTDNTGAVEVTGDLDMTLSNTTSSVAVYGNDGATNRIVKTDSNGAIHVKSVTDVVQVQSNSANLATETTQSAINTKLGGNLSVVSGGSQLATQTTLSTANSKLNDIYTEVANMTDVMVGSFPEFRLQVQSNEQNLATSDQISDMYDMMTGGNVDDKFQVQSNGENLATEDTLITVNSKLTDIDTKLAGTIQVESNNTNIATENTLSTVSSTISDIETKIDTINTELDAINTKLNDIDTKLAGNLDTTVPNILVAHVANVNLSAQTVISQPCQLHGIFMSAGTPSFHGVYVLYDATSGVTGASPSKISFGIKGVNQQYVQFPGPLTFSQGVSMRGVRGEDPTSTANSADGSNYSTLFYTV